MNKSTSIYLDLVRFLAALMVFLVHANYERFTGGLPGLSRIGGLGTDAVMVFFVLSGFVIAYVSDQKEKTIENYFVSRFARLYSVVVPALILTVVLDSIGPRLNASLYEGHWFQSDHPVSRILANLFFVNELWFNSVRPLSNGPFWSLGYEFWYYVIFAVAFYIKSPNRYFIIAAICLLIGPKILLLFPVWLLGVWVYWRLKKEDISVIFACALLVGSVLAYIFYHKMGYPKIALDWTIAWFGRDFVEGELAWSRYFINIYIVGTIVALHFIGAVTLAPHCASILKRFEIPIRYLANYTFAIYLFHYPLLQFFSALLNSPSPLFVANDLTRFLIILLGPLLAIWLLGNITEGRRGNFKNLLFSIQKIVSKKLSSTAGQ